jgi:regulator of protease activity HflC (stomatin/prohibitin superfamily)
LIGFIALIIFFSSWTIVQTGYRGVVLRTGNVVGVLEPGFHLKIPVLDEVINIETRTQKVEVTASAASKDLQTVTTSMALQFNVDPTKVEDVYTEYGTNYQVRIIDPAIQEAVKASTAKFNAEQLITDRSNVKAQVADLLKPRLLDQGILVSNVDIVNFEFSKEFDQAIEAKVTAEQQALKAENDLAKVQFEAQQAIEKAKADAEKTRLEAEALLQNSDLIRLRQAEAQLEAAKQWNGQLPTHMYGSAPLPLLDVLNQ